MEAGQTRSSGQIVVVILAAWFCFALAVEISGFYRNLGAAAVALIVWTLVALTLVVFWKIAVVREWVMTVDLTRLIAIHLTRFVGIYFLVLGSRGKLPTGFAQPAGIGDIIAAVGAVILLVLPHPSKALIRIWNFFGFIDILFVVFNALRFGLADPKSMEVLRVLPLGLLPTFLVPLIIASHVLIFIRLTRTSQ